MKKITVLLVDDHTIVREGFRKLLQLDSEFDVIGEAHDGLQAIEMVQKLHPEIVLMDIAMPNLNGLTAAKQILKRVPATKILILSAHCEEAYVSGAAESGARGFLLKQSSAREVGQAIRAVHSGQPFFSVQLPGSSDIMHARPSGHLMHNTKAVRLTPRELEVLQLISEGKANKEAAFRLQIAVKTIEKHRENLMRKLDIHDTASLTRYAISAGIIESGVQATTI